MRAVRACWKAMATIALVAAILPSQSLLLLLKLDRAASSWGRLWHRAVCRVLRITVDVEGQPVADAQVAYVGNHLSYLDIPVLGSLVRGSFAAKREVRGWPLFGWLARLQRTVFISRDRRDAAHASEQMAQSLDSGRNLIVFPEGTSSPGVAVLPFKSSVFHAFGPRLPRGLRIQPFTIDLRCVDGRRAVGLAVRNLYAYHADMRLARHLWRFMQGRGATVRVVFHPALRLPPGLDRKRIAALAEARVAQGLCGDRSPAGACDTGVAAVPSIEACAEAAVDHHHGPSW